VGSRQGEESNAKRNHIVGSGFINTNDTDYFVETEIK
jgi:hypothetical protein